MQAMGRKAVRVLDNTHDGIMLEIAGSGIGLMAGSVFYADSGGQVLTMTIGPRMPMSPTSTMVTVSFLYG